MKSTLLSVFLLISACCFGQNIIKGKVTDENNQGIPGANIIVVGTSQGAVTDVEGGFTLADVPADAKLAFSFVGYVTQIIQVGTQTNFNVKLESDVKSLEEVVVIGYGTSTVKELSGSIARISGKDLISRNPVRMDQALQGQVSGVQISTASASPGGAANIRIRGLGSNGNNNPLIVVDGIIYPVEGLNALNPSDIESINVLKDASASIYGVLAGNGVIIVTTKQGKRKDKPSIEFSGYIGMQETSKKLDLLNARQFAILKNEMFAAGGQTPPFNNPDLGKGTDWQDAIFQKSPMQNYNLTVTGGSDKSSYSIGGSYLSQIGIVGGDKASYKRYNFRVNFSTDITSKIKLQNILLYTNESRNALAEGGIGSVLYNTINASPAASPYKTDGTYTYLEEFHDIINPLAQIANTFNRATSNKLVGKEELNYKINDRFEVTARAGYSYSNVNSKDFYPLVYYGLTKAQNTTNNENLLPDSIDIGFGTKNKVLNQNSVVQANRTYFGYNLEIYLNYNQTFNKHSVKGTLGLTRAEDSGKGIAGKGYNVPYNSFDFADLSLTDPTSLQQKTYADPTPYSSRLQSVFVRGEYNYQAKYLFSALVRRDISSKFGPQYRVGNFFAFSGAWIASAEPFFKSKVIQFLKVRASYGVSGNDRIGIYDYRASLGGQGVYTFNNQLTNGVAIGKFGNPYLKWENNHQTNIGVDLTILKGKVDITADYFVKKTTDLLFQPDISSIVGAYGPGVFSPTVNGGDVQNTGIELGINYANQVSSDFSYNLNFNLTKIKNEVTYLPVQFFPGGQFGIGGNNYATRMQVGHPIGSYFGFQTDGVYQTTEEIADRGVLQEGAKPGDLRYVDQDGSKNINFGDNSDKTFLGSAIPDATIGLNAGANFKGFDFSISLYASIGNKLLRNYERQQPLANILSYRIARWTGSGSTNENPRLSTGANDVAYHNNELSNYFIEDGSYLRIKNIQLGYSLPSSITKRIRAQKVRFYIAANNLATFTKYRGFDPDFNSSGPLDGGIDYGAYPQARIYMVGFNLNF